KAPFVIFPFNLVLSFRFWDFEFGIWNAGFPCPSSTPLDIVSAVKPQPLRIVLAALLAAFFLGATPPDPNTNPTVTGGQPWSRFRGPNGCGLSDNDIPAQWTEKNYAWKTALPAGGNSSPIVYKDRIFVLC